MSTVKIRTPYLAMLSIGMVMLLLGCGLFSDGQEASVGEGGAPSVSSPAPPRMAVPTPKAADTEGGTPPSNEVAAPSMSFGYGGPRSLEQRILASSVIVRIRLDSATSTVESGSTYLGMKHFVRLEFSFSVLEYLKGQPSTGSGDSGGGDIVAVWDAASLFDTRQEAEAALPTVIVARDTQWDDREAIIFFRQEYQEFLQSTQQVDRYYLSWGGSWSIPDDGYSIASIHDKLWLPAASASSQLGGDGQRFLVDVPSETGEAPTITLGEMKAKIAAVEAKLSAGDGSEEYMQCVLDTYEIERSKIYFEEQYPDRNYADPFFPLEHTIGSGLYATSTLYEDDQGYGYPPDDRNRLWFNGGDSGLFTVQLGDVVPYDSTGDGVNDAISFDRRVVTVRPLPKGVYKFHANELSAYFRRCDGYTWRYEWTVTVLAPEGTLHEAFFDPVTAGNAVVADSTNGVLKPASFSDASGATTTIERIAWEAGTVSIELSPHTGVASHAVDFIALDGSVSLSLDVADATVDAANNTLSWPSASQPWHSGDDLMLRIREAPPR